MVLSLCLNTSPNREPCKMTQFIYEKDFPSMKPHLLLCNSYPQRTPDPFSYLLLTSLFCNKLDICNCLKYASYKQNKAKQSKAKQNITKQNKTHASYDLASFALNQLAFFSPNESLFISIPIQHNSFEPMLPEHLLSARHRLGAMGKGRNKSALTL